VIGAGRTIRKWVATFALLSVHLAAIPGSAQESNRAKSNDDKVQELLNDPRYPFEDLLKAKPGAVANAEQIFALTGDHELKQRMASVLVSIGVKDQVYYDYLVHAATEALNNDMPWPSMYDEHGKLNRKADNPAFVAWCKKHGLNPNDEGYAAYRAANPVFLEWCIEHHLSPQKCALFRLL
jgi:hypothetical protein